jgi:hypothetical protein
MEYNSTDMSFESEQSPNGSRSMCYIYTFQDTCEDKTVLGNKGANLVTMTRLGLPVPPGFILSVDSYADYKKNGRLPEMEIKQAVADLEKAGQGTSGICPLFGTCIHAGHDGYSFERKRYAGYEDGSQTSL